MPQTFHATELPLGDVFSDDFVFRVPEYQRPYAWGPQQADALFSDIFTSYEESRELNDVRPYFLGSIVIIKSPDDSKASVVDGQQRLATLTLLYAAIRDATRGSFSDSVQQCILQPPNPLAQLSEQFRVNLRDLDDYVFKSLVGKPNSTKNIVQVISTSDDTDPQRLLAANLKVLCENVDALDEATRENFASFLTRYCYIVVISVSDEESAFRIFSILNDRGLDLAPTDVLKAEIIGRIPEEQRSTYNTLWESCEEYLGREAFNDLFSHIRFIRMGGRSKRSLVHDFREEILKQEAPREVFDEIIDPLSNAYISILEKRVSSPIFDDNIKLKREANEILRSLARLPFSDWQTVALLAVRQQNDWGANRFVACLRALEEICFYFLGTGTRINKRLSRWADAIQQLDGPNAGASVPRPLLLTPNERRSLEARLNGDIYDEKRFRMAVLAKINDLKGREDGTLFDYEGATIEHVLPQKVTEGSYWAHQFPDKRMRSIWKNKLANLILLSKRRNVRASNYDFERKKREYFFREGSSSFALTNEIQTVSDWSMDYLEHRQSQLVSELMSSWRGQIAAE